MDYKEIESFLTNLKSVISCKITTDDKDNIREIHVLADNSRHTKQVARDIRSTVLTNFDLAVDYKIISVAQILKDLYVNTNFRLNYDGFINETFTDYIKISVKLSWGENEYVGITQGIKSDKNTLKIAANATIDAVKKAIGLDCFVLEDIQSGKIDGHDVLLTAITHIDHGEESVLIGSSVISNNKIETAIKSTLNAINRRVCMFFKEWRGWQNIFKNSVANPSCSSSEPIRDFLRRISKWKKLCQ